MLLRYLVIIFVSFSKRSESTNSLVNARSESTNSLVNSLDLFIASPLPPSMVAGSTFGSASSSSSSSSSFSLLELHAIRVDAFGKRSIDETIDGSDSWARVSAIVSDDVIEESIGIGSGSNSPQSDDASSEDEVLVEDRRRAF